MISKLHQLDSLGETLLLSSTPLVRNSYGKFLQVCKKLITLYNSLGESPA